MIFHCYPAEHAANVAGAFAPSVSDSPPTPPPSAGAAAAVVIVIVVDDVDDDDDAGVVVAVGVAAVHVAAAPAAAEHAPNAVGASAPYAAGLPPTPPAFAPG